MPLKPPPAYLLDLGCSSWSPSLYLAMYRYCSSSPGPLPFNVETRPGLSSLGPNKASGFQCPFLKSGLLPSLPLRSHNSLLASSRKKVLPSTPPQRPPHPPLTGGLRVTPGAGAPVRFAKSGRGSGLLSRPARSCRPQAWGSGT